MKVKRVLVELRALIWMLGLLLSSTIVLASTEHFPGQIVGNNIQGDSVLIEDDKIGTSYWNSIQVNSSVKNMVLFEMDEESFSIPPKSGVYRVDLTIEVWDSADVNNTNPTTTLYQTLEFDYDTTKTNKTPFRSFIQLEGYHRMKIEVTTLTFPTGVSSAPLRVYGEIIIDRIYEFDCHQAVDFATGAFPSTLQSNSFTVEWDPIVTVDEYDLEWAFYDSLSTVASDNGTYQDFNHLFRHNATRITTDQSSYELQLLYPAGAVFFRIRAVHYNADGVREYSKWNAVTSSGTTYANFPHQIEVGWHEADYNWQSRVLFAEEGKNVPSISYFDGSQRGRQDVTLSNTDTMSLVSQTIYDYHGRPAISVLPAPTFQSHMRYDSSFALNSSLETYTKADFDEGACSVLPASMSTSAGASKYFSPLNPRASDGFHRFIPDAEGFPFAVTEYTPDQTGRIKRQGGVGDTLGIRKGHDTQYLYGKPDQEELDRLFGNEAGDKSHYFKNAVISPDSQISVSYLDAHGRTIATALAGEQPESLDSLPNKTAVSSLKRDLLNNLKTTYTLSSTYSLLVTTVTDSLIFDYQLDSALYQPSCVDTSICYDCLYDLEITISDNCGNAFNGGNPYIITQANATPSTYDTLCTNLPAGIDTLFSLQNLPIGEYKITKTLQINQEALNYYADHYLTQSDCLPSLDSLIEAFKSETDFSGCGMDCDSCLDDLGTQADFINRVKQSLLDAGGTFSNEDSLDLVTQYAQLVTECKGLCLIVDECEALLSQMRADVTPGGQYALVTFDPLAINTTDATSIFYQNSYQDSTLQYTNQNGQPDTVIIDGISYIPNQLDSLQFVQNWNPAWADTLIKYFHPEYCYLDWCWMNEASNSYDAELEGITTLTDAINSGFVDSLGNINLDDDPFFQTGGKGEDCQASMDSLLQHMNPYDTTSFSIIDFIEQQIYGGGFPCDTNFGEGTTAENNLAWEVLRNFYFGFKERIKQDKRDALQNCDPEVDCIGTSAGSCATSPYRNKIRRLNPIRITAADYSLDSLAAGQANALQEIATECAENCANNVNYWLQRLAGCSLLDSLQRDTAITRMQAVCELGCDSEHLFGASTTALDVNGQHLVTTYGDTSFVQILTDLLGSANYCDLDCSANMIDFPTPYESQYQGPKPILSKNECLCENLADLEACYTADSLGYADFSSYLLQFSSTPLTLAEIDTLKRYCGELSASRYLPQQIDIPPYLECGICKSCDEVQPLVTQFNAICTDTSSLDYPELRARYLNQQLGLSITTLEYDNFLAQCSSNPFPAGCGTAPMLCPSTPFEKVVPDTSCYSTLMAQITVQAQLAYQDLLDSLRAAFINAYLDSCLNTPAESFDLEGTFQEYQYTLYYYDLAGNLVKTIPPKGVNPLSTQGALDSVAAHRADPSEPMILPEHTLPTVYVYNSLNEIIWEDNPDADSIQYWYDRVGRLVASQDGVQRSNIYHVTQYDELGRVVEVSARSTSTSLTDAIAKDDVSLASWLNGTGALEAIVTYYDESPFSITGFDPKNLRSRVTAVTYYENFLYASEPFTTASHYSYDITGNVNSLVQENHFADYYAAMRFKRVDYDYDFLSGNVNAVYYQRGEWDQFTHRYQYDANNRLSNVFTSLSYIEEPLESPLWEQDATYDYYLHGPLARTELGHYRVQGMDYAYNLQGWIKGVNSGHLDPTRDMGQDGKSGGTLSQRGIARDAYGYTLGYFNGDYQPIGGSSSNFELAYTGSTFANSDSSLYNGNIRQIVAHNKQLGAARGHSYRYDQLHRIRKSRIWEYSDAGTYSWVGTGTATNKHLTAYQYDPNGNITNLIRYNESPLIIDNLGYGYYDGTNQLSKIADGHSGTAGVPSGQPNNNYHYDENGNLIIDLQNNDDISWTQFNKVRRVLDFHQGQRQIIFTYGPDQSRWVKASSAYFHFYTRDANGNILATYEHTGNPNEPDSFILVWKDAYLYGSNRIGVVQPGLSYEGLYNNPTANNLPDSSIFASDSVTLCLGWKSYEIANHLGNVTATISDRKRPIDNNTDGIADYFDPTILTAADYYPFGMEMPNRTFNAGVYRFGFNGKEVDHNGEWGSLNHYDYGFRIYNPGIAKFLSVDPLRREYPWYTPYQFAGNTPIQAIDIDGLEPGKVNGGGTLDCPDCAASLDVDEDWITVTAKRLPESFTRVVDPGLSSDPISRAIIRRIQAGDHDFSIRGAISSNSVDGYSSSNYTDGVKNVFGGLLWAGGGAPLLAATFGASANLGGTFLKGAGINLAAQTAVHSGITMYQGNFSVAEIGRRIDWADVSLGGLSGGGSIIKTFSFQVLFPSFLDINLSNGLSITGGGLLNSRFIQNKSITATGIDLGVNSLFFGLGSLSRVKAVSKEEGIDNFLNYLHARHNGNWFQAKRWELTILSAFRRPTFYQKSFLRIQNISISTGDYFDFGSEGISNPLKEFDQK